MIKNLLLAVGMTLMPSGNLQPKNATITQTQTLSTKPTTKTNIYTNNTYNTDNVLTFGREIATLEFETKYYGNIVTINQRGVITTIREIENEQATINIKVLTEITTNVVNTIKINIQDILNIPLQNIYSYQYNDSYYKVYDYTEINDGDIQEFIEGKNYTSYNEINSLNFYTDINTQIYSTYLNTNTTYGTNNTYAPQRYYLTEINILYEGDEGEDYLELYNNKNIIQQKNIIIKYQTTITTENYEVIDLPNLMFQILGMPFAWFSIAFNFTLFPGTPYAINLSHLLLSLLVSLIAIIIMRIIWGKQ